METELQKKDRYINDIKEVYEQDILKLRNQLQSATHTMDESVNKLYKVMEENSNLVKQNIELMGLKGKTQESLKTLYLIDSLLSYMWNRYAPNSYKEEEIKIYNECIDWLRNRQKTIKEAHL